MVTDLQASLSKLQRAFLKNDRDEKLQNKNLRVAQAEIEHAQKDKELAETARKPLQEEQTAAEKEMNDLLDQMDEVGAAAQKAKDNTRTVGFAMTPFAPALIRRESCVPPSAA